MSRRSSRRRRHRARARLQRRSVRSRDRRPTLARHLRALLDARRRGPRRPRSATLRAARARASATCSLVRGTTPHARCRGARCRAADRRAQAARTPEAVAVACDAPATLTYRELDGAQRTSSRATCAALGVARERRVGDLPRARSPSWSSRCSACSRPAAPTCRSTPSYPPIGSPTWSPTRACGSCSSGPGRPAGTTSATARPWSARSSSTSPPARSPGNRPRRWPTHRRSISSRTCSTPRARPAGPRACHIQHGALVNFLESMRDAPRHRPTATRCSR